jgi:hypothetical protein
MDNLSAFIVGAGGAAVVKGLFDLVHWFLNRKAKKEDAAEEKEQLDAKELMRRMDVLFLADRTILYDRIKHLGKSYIARGWLTVEELEDLKTMHEVYHDPDKLNGNGFLDDLMYTVTHTLEIRAK